MRCLKTTFLLLFSFALMGGCQNTPPPKPGTPGLALTYFGGTQFVYYGGGLIQKNLNYRYSPEKLKWPKQVYDKKLKDWKFIRHKSQWSLHVKGRVRIDQPGDYSFKCEGTNGWLFLDNLWLRLDKTHRLNLSSGYHPIEIFQKQSESNGNISCDISWKKPESVQFEPIPATCLSHLRQDENSPQALQPEFDFRKPTHASRDNMIFEFEVPEPGYYQFSLRCANDFKWGNINPHNAEAFLDSKPLFHHYNAMLMREPGFFDDLSATRYLDAGKHILTINANEVKKILPKRHNTPRLWAYKISFAQQDERTLSITEAKPGETVLKKGESLDLIFQRSTLGQKKKQYSIEVLKQRSASNQPIWEKTVTLEADEKIAKAALKYPCDKEGAFEYRVLDENGQLIEGPWQFLVIDPTPLPIPRLGQEIPEKKAVLVDTIECVEDSGGEHKFRDNGTSKIITGTNGLKYRETGDHSGYYIYVNEGNKAREPLEVVAQDIPQVRDDCVATVHEHPKKHRDGRLIKQLIFNGTKYTKYPHKLCPKKPNGRKIGINDQDWFAYTFKVKHPEKAHMIVAWLPCDRYRRIPIQAIDHVTGHYNGAVLEVIPDPKKRMVKLMFPFWPNTNAFDITTFPSQNRHDTISTRSAVIKFELYEYPDGLPALPQAASGWINDREVGWTGEQANLGPEVRTSPRLWSDDFKLPQAVSHDNWGMGMFYDYKAYFQAWSRFGEYSQWRGDNLLVWPIHTYGMAHARTKRLSWGQDMFTKGYGYRPVDKYPHETLKAILLLCEKYGVDFVADLQINSLVTEESLAKLIAQTENASPLDLEHLFWEGGRQWPIRVLNPANPAARSFLIHFYGELAEKYGKYRAFKGIKIRSWHQCTSTTAASFLGYNIGYGDYTIKKFEEDTGAKVPSPKNPKNKIQERYDFLVKNREIRKKWFAWREKIVSSLRQEILAEMKRYAPRMRIYSSCNYQHKKVLGHGLDDGYDNNRELGVSTTITHAVQGVEINKLDPETYKNFDIRKGVEKATFKDKLSARVCYPDGMCTGYGISTLQLEQLSIPLAKKPVDSITQSGVWSLPATTEAIRNWVQTWRAIPDLPYRRISPSDAHVVCWTAINDDDQSVFYLINTTDKTQNASLVINGKNSKAIDMINGKKMDSTICELAPYELRLFKTSQGTLMNVLESKNIPSPNTAKSQTCAPIWAVPEVNQRIILDINNPKGLPRKNSLVVISGKTILESIPQSNIETSKIRVFEGKTEIVCQIDAKDASGNHVSRKANNLTQFDELCFQVSFAPNEKNKKVCVYFGSNSKKSNSPFKIQNDQTPTINAPYSLLIDNGLIKAGFVKYGSIKEKPQTCDGAPKPGKQKAATPQNNDSSLKKKSCNGGLSYLEIDNEAVLRMSTPDGRYMGLLPFRDWPGDLTQPRVVASGPVRIIVELDLPNKTDVDWIFTSTNRHFMDCYLKGATAKQRLQITANSPVIRQQRVIMFEQDLLSTFKMTPNWFELTNFGDKNSGKLFCASKDDKTWTKTWSDEKNMGFKIDPKKLDNWFAVFDTKINKGIELVTEHPLNSINFSTRCLLRYSKDQLLNHSLTITDFVIALRDTLPANALAWNKRLNTPIEKTITFEELSGD